MIRASVLLGTLAAAALSTLALPTSALADIRQASGGTLRLLDRMTDQVQDLHLNSGEAGALGRLAVTLDDCRYPEGEPADSIGHVTIRDAESGDPVFAGWMSAASPALNGLDHPRYDVWLLTCDAPEPAPEPAPEGG